MDEEKLCKIDALIAEKVMGWKLDETEYWWVNDNGLSRRKIIWRPSRYIADAWRVVEKLRESLIFQFGDAWDENDKKVYSANFQYNDSYTWQNYEAYAETAPLAICLAALKAVGVDIDEYE